ncbi:hypothetical protein HYALB_00013177 [Hymenoscyphus albidus]|uniref:Uncharacterized protein n=1 Tax=Hymenoscyphus albidus TaxID=595503 RepID=A0A9N9LMT9_9HELO|nr:hypothetical protein HYALB_00013177 [Hymenoscyphus albidus]
MAASPDDFPDPDDIVIPPPNKSQRTPRKKTAGQRRRRTARVLEKVHDARDKERPDRRQRAVTPTGLNAPKEARPIPLRERYGARGNAAYGAIRPARRTGQGQGQAGSRSQTRGRRTAPSVPDPDSEIVASLTPAERDDSYNAPMYPSREARELLFPWLAQGFIPQVTPGTGAQCGVYALYGSWMAACDWYNSQSIAFPTQNDDGTPITVKDFNDLLNSDEYTERAVQVARRMYANDSAAALDAAVREAEAKS